MEDRRIQVTIITGFLGAGKTTLLNHIIKQNPNKKLAIIENEFGEVGIDSELVIGAQDGIFELSNGCLCCTLNNDLIEVLNKLLKQAKKIDHLIVETTGIADPGPIAMSFLSDYTVQEAFRLNGIVTIVNAEFIEQQLEDQEEACKQVAEADLILLNKIDRVESYSKDSVKNIIKRMNEDAEILECNYGSVEGLNVLELNSFSKEAILTKFEQKYKHRKEQKYIPVAASNTNSSLLHGNLKPISHSAIRSYSFTFSEPLDPLRFKIWIGMVLNMQACPVYRSKGILQFRDLEQKIIFQAVNNQYVTEGGGEWVSSDRKETKIVFIGKNLPKELLEHGLKVCTSDKPFDPREFYNEVNKVS
jgi:G3E family GTPase